MTLDSPNHYGRTQTGRKEKATREQVGAEAAAATRVFQERPARTGMNLAFLSGIQVSLKDHTPRPCNNSEDSNPPPMYHLPLLTTVGTDYMAAWRKMCGQK